MAYLYLYLSGSDYVSIIPARYENKNGSYYRQKALITYNTENYLTRDFSLTLKSGRKIYFERSYFGVKDAGGTVITRSYISSTASGFYMYLIYNSYNDKYFLYVSRGEVAGVSGTTYAGIFLDNVGKRYDNGNPITWNDFIAQWPMYKAYPYNYTRLGGLSFSSETGDALLSWDLTTTSTGPYNGFAPISDLYGNYYVDITDAVAPEDFGNVINYQVSTNLIGCSADPNNPVDIVPTAVSTQFKFILDTNRYFDINSVMISGDGYPSGQPVSFSWNPNTGVLNVHRVSSNITINVGAYSTPYSGGGESEPGAGNPTYDFTSEEVPFGPIPILGGLNAGFITLYAPTMPELQNLARYMWAGAFDSANFRKLVANPMDAILGLSILPLTRHELGADGAYTQDDYIAVGNITTTVPSKMVTKQYVSINCGYINLKGVWGSYLDFAPFTRIQLYLPYIGFVELSADDCMNSFISIKYQVDVYSGACLAQIYCRDETEEEIGHVLYQFSGNCASWYPITSGQYQNFVISAYNILTGVGMGLSQVLSGIEDLTARKYTVDTKSADGDDSPTGGVGGAIGKMISGSASSAESIYSNVMASLKPAIQRSGGTGGSAFMMAPQYPYIIVTTPKMIIPGEQNRMIGYPSYVTMSLGSLNGFTSVDAIHPEGIDAMDEEISEIISLLKRGVFL